MMSLRHIFSISLSLLGLSLCLRVLTNPAHANVQPILPHQASRVLLITAHPDDECMFFGPTLTNLKSSSLAADSRSVPEVFSLCLSVGDADGLGAVRKQELGRSLDILHIPDDHRWLIDHPDIKDNFTARWDTALIAETIKPYVLGHNIDTVLTFDFEGISLHPNHKSIPYGVARLLEDFQASDPPHGVRAFGLVTVPIIHKYIGPLSALLARFDLAVNELLHYLLAFPTDTGLPAFVSGIPQYKTIWRAMLQHHSQMVWFRWLYLAFSRYMWVNEWIEIIADPPVEV